MQEGQEVPCKGEPCSSLESLQDTKYRVLAPKFGINQPKGILGKGCMKIARAEIIREIWGISGVFLHKPFSNIDVAL